jgi:hypothetical protein
MKRELAKEIQAGQNRINFLKDNCDKAEKKSYMKPFTADQLLQMKEELSENAIRYNDIELEKKQMSNEFKERMKPLSERKSELLSGLKNKAELVTEDCYKFVDIATREVGFYNESGDLIESRGAYADELQTNIFQLQRTGTSE